ncbi:MAG: ATPase [Methylobacterium sp.]|nr:ATPase [Methylobacterium sp.]
MPDEPAHHPPSLDSRRKAEPERRQGGWMWRHWATRTRMIAVVLVIDAVAALVSMGIVVLNARSAVVVEMQASLATVEPLVADTIGAGQVDAPDALLRTLDLRFQTLRHVRVTLVDMNGKSPEVPQVRRERYTAPDWFVALIAPPVQRHEIPILVGAQRVGTARITTEPRDEIDEIWGYAMSLSLASLCLNLALLIALYLALGRVLAPLGRLAEGLTQLEKQDYAVRLEASGSREVAVITDRFNRVAEALGEVRAANGRLNRQLLTAQDDERRRTALELHDEFGPCLFALEANAASVARIADSPEPDRSRLAARAQDISAIVGQVQTLNRDLLNRLRPHGLGQVALAASLDLLLRDFSRRHPETIFTGAFEALAQGYGDLVDLTVFRCIQESMTNAVRHGGARRVEAEAAEKDGRLTIVVRDDGVGIASDHRIGLGLSGMRERVDALGGDFQLDTAAKGAVVRISIPIDTDRDEETISARPR